jgi:hypothetical protein
MKKSMEIARETEKSHVPEVKGQPNTRGTPARLSGREYITYDGNEMQMCNGLGRKTCT